MTDDRYDKLIQLISEITELYPDLDGVVFDDYQDPGFIVISNVDNLKQYAESAGISIDESDITENVPLLEDKGYGNDDDSNGGILH